MNPIRNSLFSKLFLLSFIILFLALGASILLIREASEKALQYKNIEVLTRHINHLGRGMAIATMDQATLDDYAKQFAVRITLVQPDGTVLFDSHQTAQKMENHGHRPEVQEALRGGIGLYQHYSKTLGKPMLYVAKKEGQVVVRLSVPMDNIDAQVWPIILRLASIEIAIGLLAILLMYFWTRRMIRPLQHLVRSVETFSKEQKILLSIEPGRDEIALLAQSFEQLLEKIKQNMDELKRLENARSEFIANVSHELKTPLTSIIGFIETLEAGALEEPQHNRRFLQIMKENVQRLSRLVNDILGLARIENERTTTERLNLAEVLMKLTEEMDLGKVPRVRLNIGSKRLTIDANREELESAFQNYIDNALKYCPEGDILIDLSKKGEMASFEVTDHGPGIAPEYQPRLFERFYRPDKTRSRDTGGTGLGLAIVKHVIEKYQGRYGMESSPGNGSRFFFELPLC